MKNTIKLLGIIAIVAVIGFSTTACGGDDEDVFITYQYYIEPLTTSSTGVSLAIYVTKNLGDYSHAEWFLNGSSVSTSHTYTPNTTGSLYAIVYKYGGSSKRTQTVTIIDY